MAERALKLRQGRTMAMAIFRGVLANSFVFIDLLSLIGLFS